MAFWDILPWLLSAITIFILWLTTEKSMLLWPIGVLAQVFWVTFSLHAHTYGLMPASFVLAALYCRGYFKWRNA